MTARVELDASQPRPRWAMGMVVVVVVKGKGVGSAADGIQFRAARVRQMPASARPRSFPPISPIAGEILI